MEIREFIPTVTQARFDHPKNYKNYSYFNFNFLKIKCRRINTTNDIIHNLMKK
jgi:hypothetical protein